jgi:hypothetical protein
MNSVLGISTSRLASILLLFLAIFITLTLNSVDFLISSHPASVPSFMEGHTSVVHEGYGQTKKHPLRMR